MARRRKTLKRLILILTLLATPVLAESELECLAKNIYFEARGEPVEGQFAIAYVTLNRVDDERWPDSICDVVYQRSQFSWTRHNQRINEARAWRRARRIAEQAIESHAEGEDNTEGAVYFNRTRALYFHAPLTVRIGNHSFFG